VIKRDGGSTDAILNKPIDPEAHSTLPSDTPMPGAENNFSLPCRRKAVELALAAAVFVAVCGSPQMARHRAKPGRQATPRPNRPARPGKRSTRRGTRSISLKRDGARRFERRHGGHGLAAADDYMATTASGMLQTKAQSSTTCAADARIFTSLEISDRKVRFYGTTALVTSLPRYRVRLPRDRFRAAFAIPVSM